MTKIDLHLHSTASDGKLSPKELIDLAIKKKVPAISITDHDTTLGNNEATEYAKNKDLEFIPGIEITITPPKNCLELHMVGLFINPDDKDLLKIPKRHRLYATFVVKKIIKKLNDLGYKISFEELLKETEGKHLGRPFIAQILMRKYPNEFIDRKDVFNKLLGKDGKAFVTPRGTSMKKAIEIIHNAGGIAIIAHPWYLGERMEKVINEFSKLGGDGVEVDYTPKESIPENMRERLKKVVKENNLVIAGGTDFHEVKENEKEMGDNGLSLQEFKRLKEYFQSKSLLFL